MSKDFLERIVLAKENKEAMEDLIADFKSFILSELSRNLYRQIDGAHDEFVTVGMMAFYEAVNSYDIEKGTFIAHARLVIRRRVTDELRRSNKGNVTKNIYEEEVANPLSMEQFEKEAARVERIEAISSFNQQLANYGIAFKDLEKKSPKNEGIKKLYQCMAEYICEEGERLQAVLKEGRLPVKDLSRVFKVNRRKIDRGRVYILACVLIKNEKFEAINGYMIGGDCRESYRA